MDWREWTEIWNIGSGMAVIAAKKKLRREGTTFKMKKKNWPQKWPKMKRCLRRSGDFLGAATALI